MKEKYRRKIEGRDRKARKDLHLARVSLAKEYEGVLVVVRGKLEQKRKETAAEILLQETLIYGVFGILYICFLIGFQVFIESS